MRSAVVVVVLGAVTSVGVATMFGLMASDWTPHPEFSPHVERNVPDVGFLQYLVMRERGGDLERLVAWPDNNLTLSQSKLQDHLPPELDTWRHLLLNERAQGAGVTCYLLHSYGWPLRCMRGAEFLDAAKKSTLLWLYKPGARGDRVICLRPDWRSLGLDTLCFAVLWWAILMFRTSLKRRLRFKRGLCPECAYDLRHDLAKGCPECGWRRVAVAVAGSA